MTRIRISPAPFPNRFHGPVHVQMVGFGPGGSGGGLFFLLCIAAVVIVVIAVLMRRRDGHGGHDSHSHDLHAADVSGALRILNERLARGDIDPEDYRARRSLLENAAPVGPAS